MARTITITLAEQDHVIPQAPIQRSREWRRLVRQPLDDLLTLVAGKITMELQNPADVVALVQHLVPILMDAPETLLDLILAYAPALATQRAYLEANAYDDELVAAFLSILKVVFPLDRLKALLGPGNQATLMNSPAPPGGSAMPTLTS